MSIIHQNSQMSVGLLGLDMSCDDDADEIETETPKGRTEPSLTYRDPIA